MNRKYVFTFGNTRAGKSTMMAAITLFLIRSHNVLFRTHDGANLLMKDWVGYLQKYKFPRPNPKGPILEIDVGIENVSKNIDFNPVGFTFLEMSGEDLAEVDFTKNGDLQGKFKEFLSKSGVCLIVVPFKKAASEDMLISSFFEILDKNSINTSTALIISKWDEAEKLGLYKNYKEFVLEKMPNTSAWLKRKSGNILNTEIFQFSIGKTKLDKNERIIDELILENAKPIVKWIYEILK